MSDETPTLIEAVPEPTPASTPPPAAPPAVQSEPALERAPDDHAPPAEAQQSAMATVEHFRIGGSAGVRVQHQGSKGVTRVTGGNDVLDGTSVRVHHDTLRAVFLSIQSAQTLEQLQRELSDLLAPAFDQLGE